MTKHVGIFEAKTHLSALVDEVEKGSEIVITRHGKPVARLAPAVPMQVEPEVVARRRAALARMRELRDSIDLRLTREEIKASIREGQR